MIRTDFPHRDAVRHDALAAPAYAAAEATDAAARELAERLAREAIESDDITSGDFDRAAKVFGGASALDCALDLYRVCGGEIPRKLLAAFVAAKLPLAYRLIEAGDAEAAAAAAEYAA